MLLIDSVADFVEMDAKTKISNADARNHFQNNIDIHNILVLKRLKQKTQILHINKVSQHIVRGDFIRAIKKLIKFRTMHEIFI